jgi:soluble calcium-activated nucleotidase 1
MLFVGGMGKEYVLPDGSIPHRNPEYVKQISPLGEVVHLNWISNYESLRRAAGYPYPSYLLHESANWSSHHKKWFFLPRRASKEAYDEVLDENRCGNILIQADKHFKNIKITKIGELNTKRGFSAFRFIPNTQDYFIIATKTEEDPITKNMKSYITVFDIDGKVRLPDQLIGENKFEGIEFL